VSSSFCVVVDVVEADADVLDFVGFFGSFLPDDFVSVVEENNINLLIVN